MPYVVGKPFKAEGRVMESGEVVTDVTALGWPNFETLLKGRFLRPAAIHDQVQESKTRRAREP